MKHIKLKLWVKLVLVGLVISTAVAFATRHSSQFGFKEVIVRIDAEQGSGFINKADVLSIAAKHGFTNGTSMPNRLNLKELETKIKEVGFVGNCEVSRDLRGNLIINIEQTQPLARVIRPRGGGMYVGKDGKKMNLSKFYTARTVVLTGDGSENIYKNDTLTSDLGKPLFEMLTFIDGDEFWQAQVAQIHVEDDHNLTFYMQVGNEAVEFGTADDFKEKFEKLKVFYRQIAPYKGWNVYKKIKLGFDNQIVCE